MQEFSFAGVYMIQVSETNDQMDKWIYWKLRRKNNKKKGNTFDLCNQNLPELLKQRAAAVVSPGPSD